MTKNTPAPTPEEVKEKLEQCFGLFEEVSEVLLEIGIQFYGGIVVTPNVKGNPDIFFVSDGTIKYDIMSNVLEYIGKNSKSFSSQSLAIAQKCKEPSVDDKCECGDVDGCPNSEPREEFDLDDSIDPNITIH